ncbi:uncharacterized protein ColSpa_10137 [Colletotrichum spaethianum]|uniref:Uncharacterized protein n=1 Tax=Colletotrichum spaethianum TaxID=700344 RepID=A0AA37PCW2_9PEZI|nr:uncharacterized protein ColSpa_10137 [Colletotrichum spaethianum]GKT49956.1 hypothetical protein ColSpa_10137 [Colletotrichum spaethianum]
MTRKGKERERDYRSAFRPGAGDPAFWSYEEDEEAEWSPLPAGDNHYGPPGGGYPPNEQTWANEPNITPGYWTPQQQLSGVETSQPFGNESLP